jgi:hypothetical protein
VRNTGNTPNVGGKLGGWDGDGESQVTGLWVNSECRVEIEVSSSDCQNGYNAQYRQYSECGKKERPGEF